MIGIVSVYKPRGVSSFDVVKQAKRAFGTKKVGHLGTLDPMAEGVLPVAIGKATRLFDYFLNKDKRYVATFYVGEETDTLDAEGEIIKQGGRMVSVDEVQKILPEFIGEIRQVPPKFSAKKINGVRAYKLAKSQIEFEPKPCNVQIYALTARKGPLDRFIELEIWCKSGTYVRSLGKDIFEKLGTFATMTKLVRTSSGPFKIENSISLEQLSLGRQEDILSVEKIFESMPKLNLTDANFKKLQYGLKVCGDKNLQDTYMVCYQNVCYGLAKNDEDGNIKVTTYLYEGEENG